MSEYAWLSCLTRFELLFVPSAPLAAWKLKLSRAMVLACFGQGRHVPLWCRQGQKLQITTTVGVVSRALLIRPCIWMACCRGWWVVHQRAPSCSKLSSEPDPSRKVSKITQTWFNTFVKAAEKLIEKVALCFYLKVRDARGEDRWGDSTDNSVLPQTATDSFSHWQELMEMWQDGHVFWGCVLCLWSQSVSFGRWEALCFAIGRLLVVRQLFPGILRWKGRDLKLHRASQAAFVQRYGDRTCSASPVRVKSCIPQSIWGKSWGEVTRRPKPMRVWHNYIILYIYIIYVYIYVRSNNKIVMCTYNYIRIYNIYLYLLYT